MFNPCPNGYRLPTVIEWNEELLSWSKQTPFDSQLKLPFSGRRVASSGSLSAVGQFGFYWTINVSNTNSHMLVFTNNNSVVPFIDNFSRANGCAVRCIKD
jgi:hypothetical protein